MYVNSVSHPLADYLNWLMRNVTIPLAGELVPARGAPAGTVEFEVDQAGLETAIRDVVARPRIVNEYGRRAAEWIRASHGWDVIGAKVAAHLGGLL